MNLTITFGTWIIPLIITAGGFLGTLFVAHQERNDSGFLAHIGTAFSGFLTICVSLAAWIVWGCMIVFGR